MPAANPATATHHPQVRKITLPVFEPDLDPLGASRKRKLEDGETEKVEKTEGAESRFVTGVPLTSMAGHTGYLTFATLAART